MEIIEKTTKNEKKKVYIFAMKSLFALELFLLYNYKFNLSIISFYVFFFFFNSINL